MIVEPDRFEVAVVTAEQDYLHAATETLLQSWRAPVPLLAEQSRPSVGLLRRLGVRLASWTSPSYSSADRYTLRDMWKAYGQRAGGDTCIPDPWQAYQLMAWYQHFLPATSHVVVSLQEHCLAQALLYASYHQLPMIPVRTIEGIAQVVNQCHPTYLTLVATIDHLPLHTLQRLYTLLGELQLHEAAWQEVSLGVLTGRDGAAVSWAVLKATLLSSLLSPRQQVITLLTTKERPTTTAHIYTRANSFEEVAAKLSQQQLDEDMPDLLLIESHGGEHNIHINRTGLICGALPEGMREDARIMETPTSPFLLPPCACGQGCFKQDILPAYALTAKHIFANSCNSLQVDATAYPTTYSVGLNMLEGPALTYVGALFLNDARHSEIFLYAAALRSGLTAGEAVCLLNNVPKGYYPTLATFLLAGNPQAQVLQPFPNHYQASVHKREEQQWEIQVDVETAVLLTIDIPLEQVEDSQLLCCKSLDLSASLPDPLYYTFVAHHDRLTLYLYPAEGSIQPGRYTFIAGVLPIHAVQTKIQRALAAYNRAVSAHLIAEQTLKNRVRQIEQLSTKLTKQVAMLITHGETLVQAIPAIEEVVRLVKEQLQLADRELLQSLLQTSASGNPYRDKVIETFYPLPVPAESTTCLCGDTLALRRMQHVIFDYQLSGGFCPRCGFVHNGPVHGVSVTWHHISHPVGSKKWTIAIQLYNPTESVIEGYGGIVLTLPRLPKVKGNISYTPQERMITIPAGKTVVAHFDLQTEGLIALDYEIYIYFVSDLTINLLDREVFVAANQPDWLLQVREGKGQIMFKAE